MSLFDKLAPIAERIAAVGDRAVPFDTVIEQVLGPTEVVIDGRRTLMCGSNNYFGLSFRPEVVAAAQQAMAREGTGTTGSRAANGTFAAHRALEARFAQIYGLPHAMIFSTGYQANLGVISGFCGPEDSIILDVESHASIYDGARLSGAQLFQFRHNSTSDLARKLAHQPRPANCLVVVEGLYSISGDVAPLGEITDLCAKSGARLLVDEAHSFGPYGRRGLGCAEAQGVLDKVDFVVGTFSKTLAGIGGFCVSRHPELKYLHFATKPYVFTASGSPATIAATAAALDLVESELDGLKEKLWSNVRRVRAGLAAAGFTIGGAESPIVPVRVGSIDHAVAMWQALLGEGVYVNIVLPPACRPDACVMRTSYSAAHSWDEIDYAVDVMSRVGRRLGIIDSAA